MKLQIPDCKKFLLYPPKTPFDARISSTSNHISKNILTKYHVIHLILFICTRVFKFDKSFFLPCHKTNVKK